jgi:hypothetical protein
LHDDTVISGVETSQDSSEMPYNYSMWPLCTLKQLVSSMGDAILWKYDQDLECAAAIAVVAAVAVVLAAAVVATAVAVAAAAVDDAADVAADVAVADVVVAVVAAIVAVVFVL